MFREVQALATQAAGSPPVPVIGSTYFGLMLRVPQGNGYDALRAMRRVRDIMAVFAALSQADKEALAGHLQQRDTEHLTPEQVAALRVRRQAEVWQSHPLLAATWGEIEREHAALAERANREIAAINAEMAAAKERQEAAAALVLEWHQQGVRLDVRNGRAVAFPAAMMTEKERGFLAAHNADIAAAVRSMWC